MSMDFEVQNDTKWIHWKKEFKTTVFVCLKFDKFQWCINSLSCFQQTNNIVNFIFCCQWFCKTWNQGSFTGVMCLIKGQGRHKGQHLSSLYTALHARTSSLYLCTHNKGQQPLSLHTQVPATIIMIMPAHTRSSILYPYTHKGQHPLSLCTQEGQQCDSPFT